MANVETVQIEVVFALPDRQVVVSLAVAPGTTLRQAAAQSGLAQQFGLDLGVMSLGIYGRLEKSPDEVVVQAGDRVEIYRPLLIDPKAARAARAAKARARRQG